jgi:hypothetical protein
MRRLQRLLLLLHLLQLPVPLLHPLPRKLLVCCCSAGSFARHLLLHLLQLLCQIMLHLMQLTVQLLLLTICTWRQQPAHTGFRHSLCTCHMQLLVWKPDTCCQPSKQQGTHHV